MSPGIMRPMIDMLSPAGEARLAQALAGRPLLALDFDGTVSRLVPDPETARMDPAVPPLLTRLATRMPVALVSGRGLQDLRARTPLTGLTLVGNHGNEWDDPAGQHDAIDAADPGVMRRNEQGRAVAGWSHALAGPLAALGSGIAVEVKTVSMSIHYRLVDDPPAMRQRLLALFAMLTPTPVVLEGKFVVNLLAPGLVTKFEAVEALVARHAASTAIFVGDDITDEHVFARAPAHWIGVRVWDSEVDRSRASSHASHAVDGVDGVIALLRRLDSLTNL